MAFASLFSASVFTAPVLASGVPMQAEKIFGNITNSVFVSAIVAIGLIWFVRSAMKNAKTIPDGRQNLVEAGVEALYNQVEAIVGKKVAPKAFPLLGTIFFFVLCSNWFGLLPGVGTIGTKHDDHGHGPAAHATASHGAPAADGHAPVAAAAAEVPHVTAEKLKEEASHVAPAETHVTPWLRPATSDYNFTLALALISMIVWFYITMRVTGPGHFLAHMFAPKHGASGVMAVVMGVILFAVGIIEMVSIASRPLSLSFRLFGNIFAGENLLHSMGDLGKTVGAPAGVAMAMKFLLPIPFYFMEVLVGLLQALVFMLLSAVYIQLATADAHDDDHGHGHGDDDHGKDAAH